MKITQLEKVELNAQKSFDGCLDDDIGSLEGILKCILLLTLRESLLDLLDLLIHQCKSDGLPPHVVDCDYLGEGPADELVREV